MFILASFQDVIFWFTSLLLSSYEVCGRPYRLLTEPFSSMCQKCDSDKIKRPLKICVLHDLLSRNDKVRVTKDLEF